MQSLQKPILVTGATGFLASHVIKQLLEQGYKVRGTVRSLANKSKNQFLYGLVPEKSANLELVEADLLKPHTWPAAVEGVDYILHVASPFPLEPPKDENVLIKPAVEGTLSVLQAGVAKGVKKVVVTSSAVAIMFGNDDGRVLGPQDWSVEEQCAPYPKSKVKAEKAAWKFWEENKGKFEMAVINPGFIVGRLFTYVGGTSEKFVADIMTGKLPGLPDIHGGVVDVRDVAEAHIKALFSPVSNGKRYIAIGEELSFRQRAQILRDEYAKYGYKVTCREIPNWVVKFGALFRPDLKMIKNDLGKVKKFNTEQTTRELGIKFHPLRKSFKEMGDSLIQLGAVPNLLPKERK